MTQASELAIAPHSGGGKPPRIIQVVENLDRGSVETWLLSMLLRARELGKPIDWTFYCALPSAGAKETIAQELGARVVHSPVPIGDKLNFARALRRELLVGRYDVLHAHHDLISGLYFATSLGVPLRRRIVHVHNADEQVLTDNRLKKAILRPVLRTLCLALADRVVGNSQHSLDTFLNGRARRRGRDVVHYLGIDGSRFRAVPGRRAELRRSLNIPQDAPVLLFAGRMTPEKNPVFTIDVLAALRRQLPGAVAVFAGSGSLEAAVRKRADELDLASAIRLLGWRDDVPEIMEACDWFMLPHPEQPVEAFGIAVVEAQLAGLRMLLSRGILDDPLLPTAAYRRLSLSEPPEKWADAAVELFRQPPPSRSAAFDALKRSPMDMDNALHDLLALYE